MLYIAIISYIPQIHQLTSGKCYHFSYFFVIFEGQRKIQSPRLLSHENHRGDKFLFFRHGRPSPQSKTKSKNDVKVEKQCMDCEEKEVKIYIKLSQKNLRHICFL